MAPKCYPMPFFCLGNPLALSVLFDVGLAQKVLNNVCCHFPLCCTPFSTCNSLPLPNMILYAESHGLGQAMSGGFGSAQLLRKPKPAQAKPGQNITIHDWGQDFQFCDRGHMTQVASIISVLTCPQHFHTHFHAPSPCFLFLSTLCTLLLINCQSCVTPNFNDFFSIYHIFWAFSKM